jgi:hypothetical protein
LHALHALERLPHEFLSSRVAKARPTPENRFKGKKRDKIIGSTIGTGLIQTGSDYSFRLFWVVFASKLPLKLILKG